MRSAKRSAPPAGLNALLSTKKKKDSAVPKNTIVATTASNNNNSNGDSEELVPPCMDVIIETEPSNIQETDANGIAPKQTLPDEHLLSNAKRSEVEPFDEFGDDGLGDLTEADLRELERIENELPQTEFENEVKCCLATPSLYKTDQELDALYALLDSDQRHAVEFASDDKRRSCWVTGQAGTGKSQIITCIVNKIARKEATRRLQAREGTTRVNKEMTPTQREAHASKPYIVAVTSSTGVSSFQVGGVTVHSYVSMTTSDLKQVRDRAKFLFEKKTSIYDRLRCTTTLVIEEVSMISGNYMNCLDLLCQIVKDCKTQPFGGLQVVVFGDLLQLQPVKMEQEGMCHQSKAWGDAIKNNILYLGTVYRQTCPQLAKLLHNIRNQTINAEDDQLLKSRIDKYGDPTAPYIYPTNYMAERKNHECLSSLGSPQVVLYQAYQWFRDQESGTAFKNSLLIDEQIQLRVGARVMLTRNFANEELANGSPGEVVDFLRIPVKLWNAIRTERAVYDDNDPKNSQRIANYSLSKVPGDISALKPALLDQIYACMKQQLVDKWAKPGYSEVGILQWQQPFQFLDFDTIPMAAPEPVSPSANGKMVRPSLPSLYLFYESNRGEASGRRTYKLVPEFKLPGRGGGTKRGPEMEHSPQNMWFPLVAFDPPNSVANKALGKQERARKLRVVMPVLHDHSIPKFIGKDQPPIHEVVAWIYQLPLMHGWAFTVHKSQGMTFDKANVDVGKGVFAKNQAYVALSRVRTLNGLFITRFDPNSIRNMDHEMVNYYKTLHKLSAEAKLRREKEAASTVQQQKQLLPPGAIAHVPTAQQTTMDKFLKN